VNLGTVLLLLSADREESADVAEVRLCVDLVLAVRPDLTSLLLTSSISLILISSLPVTLHNSFTAPMFSKNIRSCLHTHTHTHKVLMLWIVMDHCSPLKMLPY